MTDDPERPTIRISLEGAEFLRRFAEDHVGAAKMRSTIDDAIRQAEDEMFGHAFGTKKTGRERPFYSGGGIGETTSTVGEQGAEQVFRARDFGRWSDKVSEPIWTGIDPGAEGGSWSHFDFTSQTFTDYETAARNADTAEAIYGGTPCQAFATPKRSIFGTAPYLAVSEEPEVAVAAAQLRADRENIRGGSFNDADRAGLLASAEAKLKRRILAANKRRESGS